MKYFIIIFMLLGICTLTIAQNHYNTVKMEKNASKLFTEDGAWCWFSDPRAVYYEGKYKRTYAGWVDSSGSIVVGYYDHDSNVTVTKIIHGHLERDDHNNPSLLFDEKGRLQVFYSRHASKRPIYLLTSVKAEDITDWNPRRQLALNDTETYKNVRNSYTYTSIFRLREEKNRLFLFWRGSDFKPVVSTSADGGKTWSAGRIFILPERTYKDRRPYMKISSNNRDRIYIAFTDGHPRDEPVNSIYYICYHHDALWKANGEKLLNWSSIPVAPSQSVMVYNAAETGEKAWIWDVAQDGGEQPVIVFVTFPNDSSHVYRYARWDGSRWQINKMCDSGRWFPQTPAGKKEPEPNYSGGIVLDHEDPSVVYVSRQINGVFEIEKWVTEDGGVNWSVEAVTHNSRYDNVRPVAVYHACDNNPLQLLWMQITRYIHYTDFRSSIRMDLRE